MLRRLLRFPFAIAAVAMALSGAVIAAGADDLREAQKLYGEGKLQPAMEKVDEHLRSQPREPQGRFLKGLILTDQKKAAEAIQVFTALSEDFPELPEPYNNLAVLHASQGNYDKARSALELAIHAHPSYATAHENLGDVYAQLASRSYDRALQLDKNNASAQVKLAMVKDLLVAQKPGAAPAARPEPAKASKAEPAKAPASAQKPGAAIAQDENAAVAAAIQAWARAWSAKDVKAYLAAYAPEFETPGGESREAWERQRAERIEKPKFIEVTVKIQSVQLAGDEATVVIRQAYRSDTVKNESAMTLRLARIDGRWLIKQERAGG